MSGFANSHNKTNKQTKAEHSASESNFIVDEDASCMVFDKDSCKKSCLKGNCIPWSSARRYRALVPLAAAQYLELHT